MEKKTKKIGTVKEVEAEKEPGMHQHSQRKRTLPEDLSENVSAGISLLSTVEH